MKFIILCLFLVFTVKADTTDDGWIVISKKDGYTMYSKVTKDSPIRAMRAHGIVDAPIDKVTAILRNVDTATQWVPNLHERSHVEDISDTEAILYDMTDMPWPVDDRDLVVHHKLTLSEKKDSLVLYFKSVDGTKKPVPENVVRAKIHFGKIYFKPRGTKTYVELVIQVDPMGSIPKWAVNILQVSMPYDFLMALNTFAGKTELKTPKGIMELISKLEPDRDMKLRKASSY